MQDVIILQNESKMRAALGKNVKVSLPKAFTGFCPESITFLIYIKDFQTLHHKQNSLSQFADDTAQWPFSLNVHIAAKLLQQDLLNLAM